MSVFFGDFRAKWMVSGGGNKNCTLWNDGGIVSINFNPISPENTTIPPYFQVGK